MLKHTTLAYALGGLLLSILIGLALVYGTHTDVEEYLTYDPAFDAYLSAYTSGEISRQSNVLVRFAEPMVAPEMVGAKLEGSPFKFKPEIEGTCMWQDTRTLAIQPENWLPSGQAYLATLHLSEIMEGLPEEVETFRFHFQTRPQSFQVALTASEMVYEEGSAWQQVSGVVRTVDIEEAKHIESAFEADLAGEKVPISWSHDEQKGTHTFVIKKLARKDKDYTLDLSWDGKAVGIASEGEQTITVPAKGVFRHLHTYTYTEPQSYVVLEFTEPLDEQQDLTGLISMDKQALSFAIAGNQVKVFPPQGVKGSQVLKAVAGIKSAEGTLTKKPLQTQVIFSPVKPEVRLIGKGTIMPRGKTLPFIFEAVGLKAIDVRVIKIHEDNIPQFLQVNRLNENSELKRVGEIVVEKKIDLDGDPTLNLTKWNRHAIDLANLIETDPGAIYEVALGYRRSYTFYTCGEEDEDVSMLQLSEGWYDPYMSEYSNWDYYSYNYQDRDNPCKKAFYRRNRIVRRNVLASDLGMIAKGGTDGMQFFITNLHSTAPEAGVQLTVYDFQQQVLARATTDNHGIAKVPTPKHPAFLLVAEKENQRGFLRLDDGTALSMSRFDTQGRTYYKGVKGYIYGERGVWRPGDPMYLTCILEDKEQSLPAEHPVSFELIDPKGKVVQRMVRNQGENGFYTFTAQTDADALTGNYTGRVRVGGATFTKVLKVETIMPNRLKIQLDFGEERLNPNTFGATGDLEAEWLHGATAKSLKADVAVNLTPAVTAFAKYDGFSFDDKVGRFESEEVMLFDGRLNEAGKAQIPTKIKIGKSAPGRLNANFKVKVFEPGGAFSVDRFSVPYDPYPVYAGVKAPKGDRTRNMLLTDTDHEVQIATVDPEGRPVSSRVELKFYKLNWKWWWDRSSDRIGIYNGQVNAEELQSATVSTVNGRGTWTLNVKYPDWGRYLIRITDDQGHSAAQIVYIDWPGWAGRSTDNESGGAQMLSFTADKEKYTVGEEITLNIPTGDAGRALVSIETGTRVLETYWVDAEKGTTRFSFTATKEMAPNIYAHITLLQPHAQTKNDLPIRMYGVIPLKVEDPATHLQPLLQVADQLRPNQGFSVRVNEAKGQPMTYTLAVVDEGLLSLTRFKTPDPWQTFYQRQALDVKTWDIYDYVLGAYGGEVKSLLSIGGDGANPVGEGTKPDRFRPVVKFLGPFTLQAGESKTHQLTMPNYIGEVRTMVVAGRPDGAYGMAEKASKVKQPLMVLGTLPRVLGPGERVGLPVTVFAMEDNVRTVMVDLSVGGKLLVDGNESQTMIFPSTGEQTTTFEVAVLRSLGKVPVKITARSGSETAVYETDIEIRNPNPRITDVFSQTVSDGDDWNQPIKPIGMPGTQHGVLEVSYMPPLNLGQRLRYLIRYPYGCVEQTTSSVFPQLYLTSLMDLDDGKKAQIEQNVEAGIKRLLHFQRADGGFAYWPGAGEPNLWGTNYAGHFLLTASELGYELPGGMISNWRRFQQDAARTFNEKDNSPWQLRTQGYRLWLLSLAGAPEMGAMNRLRKRKDLNAATKWLLAGAYHLAGQQDVAKRLTRDIAKKIDTYQELSNSYGSSMRDEAIILEMLSIMDRRDEAEALVQSLSDRLCTQNWYSTQTTAYTLLAMAEYAGKGRNERNMKFEYRLKNSGTWQKVSFNSPVWELELDRIAVGELQFRNKSGGPLFPRLVLDGIPMEGDNTSANNGLNMTLAYTNLNGKEIDPRKLEQGTDFMAKVTLKNPTRRNYREMVLNQIFPSGWEIHNVRLDGNEAKGDRPTYQDVRDDRVYTFFDVKAGKSKTFYVMLNAAYLGRYYHPSITSEAMYDHTINARIGGDWVEIVIPGEG